MTKIGIMSMQRVVNYGSFLQAYGLKKTIESLGNDVEFIDYKFEKSVITENSDKNLISKIINNINVIEFIKRKKHTRMFKKMYNDVFLQSIGISEKNYNKDVDTLVIGSDEVFNCLQPYPVGYSRNLFGLDYEHSKVISYAASFGYTKLEGLKKYNIDSEIKKLLKKFNSLSVRDDNSFDIVKHLTGKSPFLHLDPVLISNYDIDDTINIKFKDYIIIYAYTGRLSKKEEKYIKKFARDNNKKIISLGFYQKIADYNLIVHPLEVFAYFKNADYIITDTFHGTIFSIKTNSKFCTIIRESNRNKLTSLLTKLGREDRMVNSLNEISLLFKKEIDFTKTNEIIQSEREKTLDYLIKFL